MAFGFFKKAFGVVKGAVKIATRVATFAPGIGGPVAGALKLGGSLLGSKAKGVTNLVLAARQGVQPILQQVASGGAPVSAAVLSKVSTIMPGGAPAGGGAGRDPFKQQRKRKATAYRKRRAEGEYLERKKGRKMKRMTRSGRWVGMGVRRMMRRKKLTRAQLRAGFGGKRRMRG